MYRLTRLVTILKEELKMRRIQKHGVTFVTGETEELIHWLDHKKQDATHFSISEAQFESKKEFWNVEEDVYDVFSD